VRVSERELCPLLCNHDSLCAYKFRFELGLCVIKKHFNNFFKVFVKFIESRSLGMCPRETRNITHIEMSIRTSFNNSSKCFHNHTF